MENEYWLISVPETPNNNSARLFDKIEKCTTEGAGLSTNYRLNIPMDFRVGTLDTLLLLSDELGKHDNYMQNITFKFIRTLEEVNDAPVDSLQHNKTNRPLITALTKFEWSDRDYPTRAQDPIQVVVGSILKRMGELDDMLREQYVSWSATKGALQALKSKTEGNLTVRSLFKEVSPDDCVKMAHLSSIFVVVPSAKVELFQNKYWSEDDARPTVVPRSAKLLKKEEDFSLFRVIICSYDMDAIISRYREQGWTVRQFEYNKAEKDNTETEILRLSIQEDDIKKKLMCFCSAEYGEAFVGWMHLKVVRLFVESVLRYGLPSTYMICVINPHLGRDDAVRGQLQTLFKDLPSSSFTDREEDAEFFSYVSVSLNLNYRV